MHHGVCQDDLFSLAVQNELLEFIKRSRTNQNPPHPLLRGDLPCFSSRRPIATPARALASFASCHAACHVLPVPPSAQPVPTHHLPRCERASPFGCLARLELILALCLLCSRITLTPVQSNLFAAVILSSDQFPCIARQIRCMVLATAPDHQWTAKPTIIQTLLISNCPSAKPGSPCLLSSDPSHHT